MARENLCKCDYCNEQLEDSWYIIPIITHRVVHDEESMTETNEHDLDFCSLDHLFAYMREKSEFAT